MNNNTTLQVFRLKGNKTIFLGLLGLLSALGPLSIDMYLPGFPGIIREFSIREGAASYTLSAFLTGICLGQLICGPLLDRFGRKLPLTIGLILYCFGSLFCYLAINLETLTISRFIQALGACVGLVTPRAVVRDNYPVEENPAIFSKLVLIIGVSPILAPSLGSMIVVHYHWRSVFFVLTVLGGFLLCAVLLFFPGNKISDPSISLNPYVIVKDYLKILYAKEFTISAMVNALSSSGFYCFLSASPIVFLHYYQITELSYSLVFACIAVGLIGSSQVNLRLLKNYSSQLISKRSLRVQVTVGIFLVVLSAIYPHFMILYTIFIFLFIACQGLSTPNATSAAMASFPNKAGRAAALLGSLQMGTGAVASSLINSVTTISPVVLAIGMCLCSIAALTVSSLKRD